MTSQQVRVKEDLKHLVGLCIDAMQYKSKYPDMPDLIVDFQHRDFERIRTTLLNVLNYIDKESKEEQRQDSQLKVSRVFAVSSWVIDSPCILWGLPSLPGWRNR